MPYELMEGHNMLKIAITRVQLYYNIDSICPDLPSKFTEKQKKYLKICLKAFSAVDQSPYSYILYSRTRNHDAV